MADVSDFKIYLLAEVEDCQGQRCDETEEAELEGVPCLEAEDSQSQWDQGHGLEEDEDNDGDQELTELLLLACLEEGLFNE